MSERSWGWVIWIAGLGVLLLLAFPTLGFTIPFAILWWIGGPFYLSKEGEVGPFWQPMKPRRLWWRDIR